MAQGLLVSFKLGSQVDLLTFYENVKLTSLYIHMGKILKKSICLRTIEGRHIIFGTDTLLTKKNGNVSTSRLIDGL